MIEIKFTFILLFATRCYCKLMNELQYILKCLYNIYIARYLHIGIKRNEGGDKAVNQAIDMPGMITNSTSELHSIKTRIDECIK